MNFIINNTKWKIVELSQKEIKETVNKRKNNTDENVNSLATRFYGITYTDILEIKLDKDLPLDKKRRTLIHELTHCYIDNYITHCNKQYDEEDVCDIVSNSYDIIHNIVDKYFAKGKKND